MVDKKAPLKIVSAIGTAAPAAGSGKLLERAMADAAAKAQAEGIIDPDEIRARMLAARDQVTGSE